MPYALELRQRFTPLQNRYDLVDAQGRTLGYAEQKRMALKEKVTFFSGDDKSQVAFTLGARSIIELGATYDVQAADGSLLATIKKSVAASFLRSTYQVTLPDGRELVGQERSLFVALFRRVVDWPLFPIHFDVAAKGGQVAASVDRVMKIRDTYTIHVQDDTLDWRVAAALAVTFDAFMNR